MHASARSSASISSRKCDPDRLLVADVAREKPNIVGYLGQAAGFAWDHRVTTATSQPSWTRRLTK